MPPKGLASFFRERSICVKNLERKEKQGYGGKPDEKIRY